MKIPVGVPDFDETEVELVTAVMKSGWIARGNELEEFEKNLAKYLGVSFVVLVNSGSAAIEVALRSLEVDKKEVITTATSCSPTANAIIHSGNVPVMVDVTMDDYNIDVTKIEEQITEKTGAILPVHVYGRPAHMKKILEIAKRHNIPVIEDCAQSMGAKIDDTLTGTIGDIGCFSLNINKIITTGEGGFLATNSEKISSLAKMIRNYGRDPSGSDYCYTHFGHNFKFTNLQAAVGIAQLKKIDTLIQRRREHASYMTEKLQGVQGIKLPSENEGEFGVFFSYAIILEKEGFRDQLKKYLEEKGIEVRTMFRPMCNQPYYKKMFGEPVKEFPNAEFIGRNGLYVGCYPSLTKEQMDYITQQIISGLHDIGYN